MIKPGPDMAAEAGHDANAGWNADGDIRGFSQTHVSGTGGGAKYGNILVTPTPATLRPTTPPHPAPMSTAPPASLSQSLAQHAQRHLSVHYPSAALRQSSLRRQPLSPLRRADRRRSTPHRHSQVHILSPTEVAGSTSADRRLEQAAHSYTVYFYAKTDTPAESSGTWLDGKLSSGSKSASGGAQSKCGAWLTFPAAIGHPILMKIGISFISIEQARRNLETEIPGFDFEAVHAAAVAEWNQALRNVEIEGATPEQQQMFSTALYHTMLMPTDRTGENPLWSSSEPYYDDYYAIWDIFRTSGPLLTLIAPERQTAIVRALVDLYRHEGWLPDARSGNYNGRTQGGSNAEFMLTDAYLKGLKGIDWKTALAAETHDAEVSPADHLKEGRGGLDDWHSLGYVSIEGSDRPGSVDMEYAADDFEIALLAQGIGDTADYKKYLARSANWKKLWDQDFSDGGFTGFIRPRHRDGSWLTPFTAMDFCTWGGDTFYEGNSWTYSTFVPQDVASLIKLSGGPATFVRRLDAFFDVPGRYDVGNEPGFLAPYLYIWAGRPDKTDSRVRQIIAASYHAGPSGLPGNDDSGAMSSWYAFGQIGIFPNAGQDVYLIGSPAYRQTKLHLAGGKDFIIEARNLSKTNLYVTAATLNGEPLDRAWLHHREIAAGGRLVLTMGDVPSHWAENDLPPSTPAPE